MLNKLLQQAHKDGYQTIDELPYDYAYGGRKRTGSMLAAAKEHDMVAIMANTYCENPHSMSVERARQIMADKKTIYKEHLGRPTNASILREEKITSNIHDMLKNTLTPYKTRQQGGATTGLRRPQSTLGIRREEGQMPPRKRNTRNLMILGSSSTKNQN